MLKILERSITLQLLVFYCLFIVPLLLGGVELYLFQRNALQQSAQRADLGLAKAIALELESNVQAARLMALQQQLSNNDEVRIWIVDNKGKPLVNTERVSLQTDLRNTLPGLNNALRGEQGNLIARQQSRDWLFTYVPIPISGTRWAVVVQRPTDVTFAAVISFQNSLIIALVMLILGAVFFWLAMHGWVVAPLSKLAQAATMIKPDRTEKISDSKLLARDRGRIDEIGKLITAFSTMEDEIHSLFRKSDERSQARLHTLDAIMRSMDEGVLLENPDGKIVYANQSFIQFVGFSPQEILPDSFDTSKVSEKLLAIIEDPATYHEAILQAENMSGPYEAEFQVRGYYNQVGQLVPVRRDIRMRLFHVRDTAGQLIGRGKIFRDMTRHNEAERVKKNLLAIVSHELRTPLTSIKGYATSLLATDVELEKALQEHFLRQIVEESDHMAELVTNLLEMSQLEAGTLKLYPTICNIGSLVESVISADEENHIRVNIPEDLPLIYVDRRRIQVVLRNLLENARRYTGVDSSIGISARFEPGPNEGGLYLSILDNGAGIPPDLTERIFDRFYQVDGGRERRSSGVGLGLAICRGFIEAHGGRIWAENRTDGMTGAIFHIWFPPKLLYSHDSESNTFELLKLL